MTFETERLRDRIIDHLLAAGSDSISGVARALSDGREQPIHRLTVAGYLAAMAESGVLREVPRPPSKHYQVTNPNAHKDIYRRIGDAVRDVPMAVEQRGRTALAALVEVLGRPVFRSELHQARLPVPEDLERLVVDDEERRAMRLQIQRRHGLDLPRGDPLFGRPAESGPVAEVLRRALLDATEAWPLAADPARRGQQVALPLEADG